MEDDQLKLHQSHADRIDKTRREIQQKIREVKVSKHGGSAFSEVSALEQRYLNEVKIANKELAMQLKQK